MARLKILSGDDFNNLYVIPRLEKEDRTYLFDLDETDHAYLETLTDIPCKIDYILQLEYFKLSQYFSALHFKACDKMCGTSLKLISLSQSFQRKALVNTSNTKTVRQSCKNMKCPCMPAILNKSLSDIQRT